MATNEPLTISEAAHSLGLPKQTLRHLLQRPDRRARLLHAYRNSKKGLKTVELVPVDLLDELSRSYPPVDGAPVELADDADADQPSADLQSANEASPAPPSIEEVAEPQSPIDKPPAADDETNASADGIFDASVTEHKVTTEDTSQAASSPEVHLQTTLVEALAESDLKLSTPAQQDNNTLMIVATYERLLAERDARLAELHGALEAERATVARLANWLESTQSALKHSQESLAATVAAATEKANAEKQIPEPPIAETPVMPQKRSLWARLFSR